MRSISELTLVVGSKNYSSWSLWPYLALAHTGQPFREVLVPLDEADTAAKIAQHSPSGRVPVLRHGALVIWDSLAICEYLAETFPQARLWPQDEVELDAVGRAYRDAVLELPALKTWTEAARSEPPLKRYL